MSNNTGRRAGEPHRSQPHPSHSSARGWAMRDGELESPTYSSHPPTSTSSAHPRPPPAPNPFISSSSSSFPHPYTGRFERKLRTEMQGTAASGPPSNKQPPSSSSERSSGYPSTGTGAHTSSGSPSPACPAPSPSSATPSSSSSSTNQSAAPSDWVPKPSRLFDGGLRSAMSGQRPPGARPTGSRVRFSDDGEEGEAHAEAEVQFEVSMDVDVAEEERPEPEDAGDRVKEVPDDTPADVAASPSNANIRPQPPVAPRPPPPAPATNMRPTKTTEETRAREKTAADKPPPAATHGSAPAASQTRSQRPTSVHAPAPRRSGEPLANVHETFGRPSTSSRPQPQPQGRSASGSPTSSERSQSQQPKPAKRSKTTHPPGDQQPRPPTSSIAPSTSAAISTPTRAAPPSARPSETAPVRPLAPLPAPASVVAWLPAPAVAAAPPPVVVRPTVTITSMAASSSSGPSTQPNIPSPATVDAIVQQPPPAADPKSDQQDQRSLPQPTLIDISDGDVGSSKPGPTQQKEEVATSTGGKDKKRKRAKADDVLDEQPKKAKLALSDVLNALTDADESTRQKDTEIARLRAEVEMFKEKQQVLEGRLGGAKRLVSTFKDGYDQLCGTVSAISDAKTALDDKNRRLEKELQGLNRVRDDARHVVQHNKETLQIIDRQRAALSDMNVTLRVERDDATLRAREAERSTDALTAELVRGRADLDSRTQRVALLEADVDKKGGTITSLALQLKDRSQDELKVRQLQDQLDQASDRASTAEKLTAEAETALRHERDDHGVKLGRSDAEVSRLRDQVADLEENARAKAATVESLKKDVQTTNEAYVKAKGLIAELKIGEARAKEVEGELVRVQAAEKRATTALQAERKLLEDTRIKQKATDDELARTRAGLREARNEISGLTTQLKEADESAAANSTLRAEVERSRDQLEAEVENAEASRVASETELVKTRSDLEHAQAELITVQRGLDQATSGTADVDELRAQIATMKARQEDVVDRYWDEQLDEHERKMVLAISDTLEGIHETESDKRVKLLEAKVADLEREKADLADRLNDGMDVDEEDDKENRRPVTRRGDELSSSCLPSEAGDVDTDRVPPFKLQHRARAPSPGASSDAASPPPAQHQHQLLAHTAKNEDMDDLSSAIEALDHHSQPRSRTPVESSSPLDLSSPAPASAPAALALGPADQEHPIVITSSSPPSAFKSYEGSPLPRSSSPPAGDGDDEMAGAVAVGEEDGAEMPPPAASPAAETEDASRSGECSTSGGSQPAQKTSEQEDEDVTMEEARPSLKVVLRRTNSLGTAPVAGGSQQEGGAFTAVGEEMHGEEDEDEEEEAGAEPAKGPSPRRLRNGRIAPTTAPIIRTNSRGKKPAAPTTASTSTAAGAPTITSASTSAVAGPLHFASASAEQE